MKKFKYLLFTCLMMFSLCINVNALDNVAEINGTYYETLEAAVEAVQEGETINIISDIDATYFGEDSGNVFDFPDNVTLNLNEHTITVLNFSIIYQGNGLVIKNGIFETDINQSYALFVGDERTTSDILIEDIKTIGGINIYNAHNVVLRNVESEGHKYYAVWSDENASVVIENGQYTVTGDNGLLGVAAGNDLETPILIKSGFFVTKNGKLHPGTANAKFKIEGGTFNTDVSMYTVSDKVGTASFDGIYTVRPNNELIFNDGYGDYLVTLSTDESFDTNYSLLIGMSNTDSDNESILSDIKSKLEKSASNKKIDNVSYIVKYSIDVTDGTNIITLNDNKTYTVKIRLNDSYNYGTLKIIYFKDGKAEEVIDPTVYDGYLTFTTNHLSDYVLVELEETDEPVPSTNDNIDFYMISGIVSLLSVIGIALYTKKINN